MQSPPAFAAALATAALLFIGCDDSEVCLSDNCGPAQAGGAGGSPDLDSTPGAGGVGGPGGMGGPGGQGAGGMGPGGQGGAPPPVDPMPDSMIFADTLVDVLTTRCATSSGCHLRSDQSGRLYQLFTPAGPGAPLPEGELAENIAATIEWVDWGDLPRSPLLIYAIGENRQAGLGRGVHPETLTVGSADYQLIIDWLEDAITVEPPDAGPPDMGAAGGMGGGDGDLPCDGLPGSDPLGRDGYYAEFDDAVNPMLLARCSDGDCHGTPRTMFGNRVSRYWLKAGECSTDWNFAASQLFIDPRQPESSPLLTKPLSRNHAGQEVFMGMADPGYVLLRRWVLSGLNP